ncbi:protein NASP homolog [Anopheles darlingi]|uniref:protein NASP homolog n=1 Tax=Anopheles darlingi TaxID=43151 RepID=UPI0021003DF7|nr:protein NASP homolog [Anopheles darlingi]XP_049538018.1 protein NASP homolog [Anopheles darlingi]XP_049538019.1 protein NASP homolog [Anopheles darlingi]
MAEKSDTLVTPEDKANEAKELFGRGSRNYCMRQYSEAADDLSACCALYSEMYGSLGEECGQPYLLYAKSLIAIGKDENNLIVPGEDDEEADEDDDDGEGEEDAEGDEGAEDEGGDEEKTKQEQENGKDDEDVTMKESKDSAAAEAEAEKKENGVEAEKTEGGSSEAGKAESGANDAEPQPGPSTSNGGAKEEETTEDSAGNLQVAWEMLELAVKIFVKQGDKGYENLAECYSELAGISFENSFFQEAINDYTKALKIHTQTNNIDLRFLAEINYKMGLCHLMLNDFDASIKSFQAAVAELEKVIEEKEAIKEQTDDTKEAIAELVETKNEIIEKIADVEEAKKTSIEEVKRELSKIIVSGDGGSSSTTDGAGPSSSGSSSAIANGASASKSDTKAAKADDKPANDISHLIKRKKPDTVSAEVEGSPAKKIATETEVTEHNRSS